MTQISKQFRAIVTSVDEKNFTASVVVSTKSVDRDGDIVEPSSILKRLKSYLAQPVLLSSHRTDNLMRQIGKAVEGPTVVGDNIEVKFQWFVGDGNPEADWAFNLAKKGIAAFSIGFMPFAWEDSEESRAAGVYRRFTDIELLEISQVLVPSNREAVTARRDYAEGMEKEMLELCVKEMKWDAPVVKEPAAEVKALTEKVEALLKKVEELGKGVPCELKQFDVSDIFGNEEAKEKMLSIISEHLNKNGVLKKALKEHYSEKLLGKGAPVPTPIPTKVDLASMAKEIVNETRKG